MAGTCSVRRAAAALASEAATRLNRGYTRREAPGRFGPVAADLVDVPSARRSFPVCGRAALCARSDLAARAPRKNGTLAAAAAYIKAYERELEWRTASASVGSEARGAAPEAAVAPLEVAFNEDVLNHPRVERWHMRGRGTLEEAADAVVVYDFAKPLLEFDRLIQLANAAGRWSTDAAEACALWMWAQGRGGLSAVEADAAAPAPVKARARELAEAARARCGGADGECGEPGCEDWEYDAAAEDFGGDAFDRRWEALGKMVAAAAAAESGDE
jgi:hypothetical protein